MDESVYTCSGPGGRAEVLSCAVCRYYIYRWHNGGLYIEGEWTSLEDACKCARAVTGCEPSSTAG